MLSQTRNVIVGALLAASTLSLSAPYTLAQQQGAVMAVEPTLLAARQAKHDPALNLLTYQHMDELFGTQDVAAGSAKPTPSAALWSDSDLDIELDGKSYPIEEAMEMMRANAVVVLRDGQLVYEKYRNGSDEKTRFIAYSASKSITAILVGIALEKGAIESIDDPVDKYLPELAETAYAGTRIKYLLSMQSGTSWKESYKPGSQLYIHRERSLNLQEVYYEDYAFELEKTGKAGEGFNYSTLDTCVIGWLLDEVVEGGFSKFMSETLWRPAGMETDGYWVDQGPLDAARPFYGAGFAATERDMARIGQIMLNGGEINGTRIVSKDWIETISSPQGGLSHYGYFWWLSQDGSYAARGVNGQAIHVDPATKTVIALASYWPEAVSKERSAVREQFFAALAAKPAPQ